MFEPWNALWGNDQSPDDGGVCGGTQCENGHSVCGGCCKKLKKGCPSCEKPVGSIRNRTIEKVLESLQVACTHAPHGCKEMLKINSRGEHEKECESRPFQCPVAPCRYLGSTLMMPQHLTEEHQVRTVEISLDCGSLLFRMKPSECLVIVKNRRHELFLLHRETELVLADTISGDTFFCTSFGARQRCYDLKVSFFSTSYSVSKALAYNTLDWAMINECSGDNLFFPRNDGCKPRRYDILIGDFQSQYEDFDKLDNEDEDEDDSSDE